MLSAVGGEIYGEAGGLSCVCMYIVIMSMMIKTQALFR